MPHFIKFDRATVAPEHDRPLPERVIEGDPQFTTWLLETTPDEKTYAGYWAATPGTWRVSYHEWEYCTILEGHAIVTEDGQPFLNGGLAFLKGGNRLERIHSHTSSV